MIAVLKNNWNRLLCHKIRIFVTLGLTLAAIVMAVFVTSKSDIRGNIAYIPAGQESTLSSSYFRVTILREAPTLSDLLSNRYDAVVTAHTDGSYSIATIKSADFENTLRKVLQNPGVSLSDGDVRGVGGNIVGYLTMFLLLQSVLLMYLFADDKEQKQIVRIAASPLSFTVYLLAHCLFTFGFLFLPSVAELYLVKWVMGASIGFSFIQYLGILAVICAFGTAFSLFVNSLAHKSDSANMVGSSIVTLTSVLAGSFYSFEKGNRILEEIIRFLPQKAFLSFVDALEKGVSQTALLQLGYVIALTALFFLLGAFKTKRDYLRAN